MKIAQIIHKICLGVVIAICLAIGIIVLKPVPTIVATSPIPALTYEQARTAFQLEIASLDHARVQDDCVPILLDHGTKAARAILIFHGYTNCPKQFEPLALQLFAQGYNVYIPRLPAHGLKESSQPELHSLTATQLTTFADEQVALALGLGESVTVLGLSAGANLALWEAQHDPRITRGIAMAPVIYPHGTPTYSRDSLINILTTLPPFFIWWDAEKKDALVTAPYAYKRQSSRASGEILAIGKSFEQGLASGLLARPITIFANRNDEAVDFSALEKLHASTTPLQPQSSFIAFPQTNLPHDVIDVHNNPHTTEAYTFILEQLNNLDH